MPQELDAPSFDHCLRALEDERRRIVLAALSDVEDPAATVGLTALSGGEAEVRLALIHQHLPMLADGGYVDWNRDPDRVGRGPRFDDAEALLDLIRTHEDDLPWTAV